MLLVGNELTNQGSAHAKRPCKGRMRASRLSHNKHCFDTVRSRRSKSKQSPIFLVRLNVQTALVVLM